MTTKTENVQVVVRFRALEKNEYSGASDIYMTDNRIKIGNSDFIFDRVFSDKVSQKEMFDVVGTPTVNSVCEGYNATIFAYGASGCLKPTTLVMLYSGQMIMAKDVKVGDLLMGDDSKPRRVLELFQGIDDMFEIKPLLGNSYTVNSSHILTLKTGNDIVDIPVIEMINSEKIYETVKVIIHFPEKKVEDPYEYGLQVFNQIDDNYLYNSVGNRKLLLAGILDSKGEPYPPRMRSQIEFLIESLGYTGFFVDDVCYLNSAIVYNSERDEFLFNSLLNIPIKSEKFPERNPDRNVISVKYVNRSDYVGFSLDGNSRFLLQNGVVSHNSGKSYTMFGNSKNAGLIPRACDAIFSKLSNDREICEKSVKCSFMEIYKEHIRDLLNHTGQELIIRQTTGSTNSVYVQGLTEQHVNSSKDILELIKDGTDNRTVAATSINNVSSRSHAVLSITIGKTYADGSQTFSKLHLVDLAGSENVGRSEVQGITLTEAQNINKSLSSLGNVINALTEKNRLHIPYRDSKLTYLLQDSLGGNSKTVIIATASLADNVVSETITTLKFAKRSKEIKNIPKVNKNLSNANLLEIIEKLQKEIEIYKERLEDQKVQQEVATAEPNVDTVIFQARVIRWENRVKCLEKELADERTRFRNFCELFEKQRELCINVSRELINERMMARDILNEYEKLRARERK